jgi:hypothetical protein
MLTRVTLLTLATALPLGAQALVFAPTADATTDADQPTTNFGADPELRLGKTFTSTPSFRVWFTRAHVMFDLSSFVGSGIVPSRATFFWYQSRAMAAGCLDVSLHRITAPWSEGGVTWQNQPAHDAAIVSRTCVGDSFSLGWKAFDATALVQAWFDGSVPNHGLVIRDVRESTAGAARPGIGHSRENGNPALAPYLEVELPVTLGFGCSARGAIPALAFASGSSRSAGMFRAQASNLVIGANPAVFFGFSRTQWNGIPLPLSFAFLGFPACNLYVAAQLNAAYPVLATPALDIDVIVPDVASLVGMSLFMQVAAITPIGQLELTNGLGVTIFE